MIRTRYRSPFPGNYTGMVPMMSLTWLSRRTSRNYVEVKELFDILKKDDKKLQINTGKRYCRLFPHEKIQDHRDPATVVE